MRCARHLLAAAVGLTVALTAVPAGATEDEGPAPFLRVEDKVGDQDWLGGTKADLTAARGLDVLRVRHAIRRDRLVVVSRHKNLTAANSNLDPDEVKVGGGLTVFAAYVEPQAGSETGYLLYLDHDGTLAMTDYENPQEAVTCPGTLARVRFDVDRVRYVVPLSCVGKVTETRTMAQAIRYKVVKRQADGIEQIELVTLDQNDHRAPVLTLV